jgi:methionyl-tRNA formyltransferase
MKGSEQRHEMATYTPIITKEMGRIDWRKSTVEIDRQVRAFVFWPTAYTFLDGKMMKIFEAAIEENAEATESPGQIRAITREGILVGTGCGVLKIKEIQMENKKRMRAHDFAQGYRDLIGKVLS